MTIEADARQERTRRVNEVRRLVAGAGAVGMLQALMLIPEFKPYQRQAQELIDEWRNSWPDAPQ